MNEILCHVCNSSQYKIYGNAGSNRIVICKECGLFYVNPIPELKDVNENVQRSDIYTQDQLQKLIFFRNRAQRIFENVEKLIPPGKILDIGCAIGTELVVARERGWEGTGIELSENSVRVAQQSQLRVLSKPLEEIQFPDASFDLITLNHVLEHISEPQLFIEEIKRILKDQGFLFISIPNVNAWKRYLQGTGYYWTFHEDHFVHYSINTLSRLLRKHGFEILDISSSRWQDFHNELSQHSILFQMMNRIMEQMGMGIEIFCLCQFKK